MVATNQAADSDPLRPEPLWAHGQYGTSSLVPLLSEFSEFLELWLVEQQHGGPAGAAVLPPTRRLN